MKSPVLMLAAVALAIAKPPPAHALYDIIGQVFSVSGAPIEAGTVTLERRPGGHDGRLTRLEAAGAFRFVRVSYGMYTLRVSAPAFTGRELQLTLLPSSVTSIRLPPVVLAPAVYLRARFISRDGHAVIEPRIVGTSYDVQGRSIGDARQTWPSSAEPDGTVRIGPLPRGVAVLALDTPPFARTRLPDAIVTGERETIDAGTLHVGPGAVLRIVVTDLLGARLPGQEVHLSEGDRFSPLSWPVATTDAAGLASFDRLAAGRYRLRVGPAKRCDDPRPSAVRDVRVPSTGTTTQHVVLGEVSATLRLTSGGMPLAGVPVRFRGVAPAFSKPAWLRDAGEPFVPHVSVPEPALCSGVTDGDGRVTFQASPGAAELTVAFTHSASMRLVRIPPRDDEQSIDVPTGTLPVRVVAEPDVHAQLIPPRITATWATRGHRAEAVASPTGDVLLEAVGNTPGALTIRAPGHRTVTLGRISASRSPGTVTLERVRGASLRVIVLTSQGHPLPGAAVEVAPLDPLANPEIRITDSAGVVSFAHVAAEPVWIAAAAEGFLFSARAQVTPAAAVGAVRVILEEDHAVVDPSAMK